MVGGPLFPLGRIDGGTKAYCAGRAKHSSLDGGGRNSISAASSPLLPTKDAGRSRLEVRTYGLTEAETVASRSEWERGVGTTEHGLDFGAMEIDLPFVRIMFVYVDEHVDASSLGMLLV